jgi:thiol-disulfide isomerase/thioredoxin
MKALKTLPLLLLLLLVPLCATAGGVQKVGVKDLRGFIDSSKGRVLVINYWATWCQPCVKEFPGLVNLRRAFPESELNLVGISVDYDVRPVENFLKKHEVNFPIVIDDGSIATMLAVQSIPRTVIYNRKSEKVLDHIGFISEESYRHVVERLLTEP